MALAMCIGPESGVISRSARASNAGSCLSVSLPTRSSAGPRIAARIASVVSRSSALRPPHSTTRQPRAIAWSATAA